MEYQDTRAGLFLDVKFNGSVVMEYITDVLYNYEEAEGIDEYEFISQEKEKLFETELKINVNLDIDSNTKAEFEDTVYILATEYFDKGWIIESKYEVEPKVKVLSLEEAIRLKKNGSKFTKIDIGFDFIANDGSLTKCKNQQEKNEAISLISSMMDC